MREINTETILNEIKINGGYFIKEFFSLEEVKFLISEFNGIEKQNLNNNNNGLVYFYNQKFISQVLVHSNFIFKFLTSEKLFGTIKKYVDYPVLKASRYYLTGGGGVSMWHHDEKNDGYVSKGLIMIVYLSDVFQDNDGPFEFIEGSHDYSLQMSDEEFFTKNISSIPEQKIQTVYGAAGTIIFADSKVIHRAKPHNNKLPRKSLFFQISKYEPDMYKERLLINPMFVTENLFTKPEILSFLGFGLTSKPHIFPPSSIESLPLNFETFRLLKDWFVVRMKKQSFELLPRFFKIYIRKKIGRNVDYGAVKK
jgi:hypothetical protein